MVKKKIVIFIGILALLLAGSSPAMAGKKIINGIDANFPPFAYIDKTGNPSGFDVDAMNWIAKQMGYEVENKAFDWDGIVTNLLTNKIDIVASGMSITPDRLKMVAFTDPYWTVQHVMVVKKKSDLVLANLMNGNKVIGVQQGTPEAKWLKDEARKNGWNMELRYYNSSPQAIEDILNGRIAAVAMNDAPAKDAAGKKAVKVLGTFGMPPENFGYALRKENTKLMADINEGLKRLMASPYWQELIKKYDIKNDRKF
ncbi:MAG: amino acid ABC transporter substrate-binding protein [Desulfobacteraceae bacterium]|nr:amino acid ABC transporter substrate-binding protein [Desulfobacteraceae bacterium]